ncbi:MAG TPA: DUF2807 domain-containing protein [Steroidobacteraceae bacterium]
MNRTNKLLLLAIGGLAVSASALTVAGALEEKDLAKPAITREIAWDGSESLVVDAPAEVRFVQSAGPGKVLITGASRSVETFRIDGGVLRDERWHTGKPLRIEVHAPKVTRFVVKGGDKLTIESFDQPELHIEATGRADVTAAGRATTLKLILQGSGWADLSGLATDGAEVTVSGSRQALIAPLSWATLSGNGTVVLLTNPPRVDTNFGESGRVIRATPPLASR